MSSKHAIGSLFLKTAPRKTSRRWLTALDIVKKTLIPRALVRIFHHYKSSNLKINEFGLEFENPVGLGPGLDQNAAYCSEFSLLGFSFTEFGPVAPDMENALENLKHLKKKGSNSLISANITSNSLSTSSMQKAEDYAKSFTLLYDFVDFFTVNISLAENCEPAQTSAMQALTTMIDPLLDLRISYDSYKPILLKPSPDLSDNELDELLKYSQGSGIDGVVARRDKINHINSFTKGRLPIIAYGEITSPEQAKEVLDEGAAFIELYSELLGQGPGLVKRILKYLDTEK